MLFLRISFVFLSLLLLGCDLNYVDSVPEDIESVPYIGISFSWIQNDIPSFTNGDTAIVECIIHIDSLLLFH